MPYGPQMSVCIRSNGRLARSGATRLTTRTDFVMLQTVQSLTYFGTLLRPIVASVIPSKELQLKCPNRRCHVSDEGAVTANIADSGSGPDSFWTVLSTYDLPYRSA